MILQEVTLNNIHSLLIIRIIKYQDEFYRMNTAPIGHFTYRIKPKEFYILRQTIILTLIDTAYSYPAVTEMNGL